MNHISLTGRLTKDLELRATATGKDTVSFSLAVNDGKDSNNNPITDFINISAFGERAKLVHNYCHKGDLISVEGKLKPYVKDDGNGNKTSYYSVVMERVEFLNTKKADTTEKVEKEEPLKSISQDEIDVSDMLPF